MDLSHPGINVELPDKEAVDNWRKMSHESLRKNILNVFKFLIYVEFMVSGC